MIRRLLPFTLLALGACDPCSGLGSCAAPHVRYEGLLTRSIGLGLAGPPARGIEVKFVPTGGVALEEDTLVARTDDEGRFILSGGARAEGEVQGDLILYPPAPIAPVRVEGLSMRTTRGVGDLRRLGSWKIPFHYLGYQFHLFHRADLRPAQGIEVVFRRTGGLQIEPDSVRARVDSRGYVILRPDVPGAGTVTGDLTVYPLPPHRPFTLRGLTMRTVSEERFDSIFEVGIGYRAPYSAIIVWANSGQGIEGVQVEFRRTGGVPIFPERFTSTTDRFGTVHLNPVPLEPGEVRGDVIITPPAPGIPDTIYDLRLPTIEDQRQPELLGYWGVSVAEAAP